MLTGKILFFDHHSNKDFLPQSTLHQLYTNGEYQQVKNSIARIFQGGEASADYFALLAVCDQQLKGELAARNRFEQGLKISQRSAFLDYVYGNWLAVSKDPRAAASYWGAVVDSALPEPQRVESGHCLASLLLQNGDISQAISVYKRLLKSYPSNHSCLVELGKIFLSTSNPAKAANQLNKALKLLPDDVECLYHFAGALAKLGRTAKALKVYKKILLIEPRHAESLGRIGVLFRQLNQSEMALQAYDQALRIEPGYSHLIVNRANILVDTGRYREAISCYRKELVNRPDSHECRYSLAAALLADGQFSEGWQHYQVRQKLTPHNYQAKPKHLSQWQGPSAKPSRLMVQGEQGIGDELMFASCLAEALFYNEAVVVECEARLVPLLARSFSNCDVYPHGQTPKHVLASLETHCLLGDLARYFRPNTESFSSNKPYLKADSTRVSYWRKQFKCLKPQQKVGISWAGGGNARDQLIRSLPLALVKQLAQLDYEFINLQYGELAADTDGYVARWPELDPLKDIDEQAALIAALDLIICVDNATAHLAAALGKKTWILLPTCSEWRWMANRSDSLWYPTAKLYRQTHANTWVDVVDQLKNDLSDLKETANS